MRDLLDRLIRDALRVVAARDELEGLDGLEPGLERTRDSRHGDFASNVAMRAAKAFGTAPRTLAASITDCIAASDQIESIEIAGPGFINFKLAPAAFYETVREILKRGANYGAREPGSGERVLVEYVSANPTGPLHVGHGRHAAYGASLASILRAVGHDVDEEYYVNDAGRQMEILAASVWLRYAELLGIALEFPAKAYQGEYVRSIAASIRDEHDGSLLGEHAKVGAAIANGGANDDEALDSLIAATKSAIGQQQFQSVLDVALDSVLADIKDDLAGFGVNPKRWFSERSLIDAKAIDAALDALEERKLLYLEDGATWFRTTEFGDDKDRVVKRANGVHTYFASDIAYHFDKLSRGYDRLLDVLGSDHHGYMARVRAGLEALGNAGDRFEVELMQFVVLYRGKVKAQMSTRSGEYVTLRELRDEVGNDAARFFYVSRSNDQHLEFDLELAKSRTNENPVYYVQYAHARVASMLERMSEQDLQAPGSAAMDLAPLKADEEFALMRSLSRYSEVVELAADNRAPQHIVHYLRDLAAEFHSYYNSHRVLVDDAGLRDARIQLAVATRQVIANALALLGVSAPDKM